MSDHIPSRTERRKQQELDKKAGSKKGRKPGGKKKKPLLRRIISAIVLLGVIFFVAGAALFTYYAASAPKLDEESLKDPLSSELYAMGSDEPFMTLGAQNREYVEYEDIPDEMREAILATEDVRFFKHHGIDFWRLGGAVLANFRDGFGSQGASTITQQVIKNSFLQNEKTLKRKAQEAWLAFQLERKYSKEEIFEMYFNKVLMSGNIYGMGTAADSFYGKEPADLSLNEMALLAGMPQSPNRYNPYNHPERAEKRRNIVLGLMVQHGKITQAQADEAKSVPITEGLVPPEQRKQHNTGQYAAFVDLISAELEDHDLSISDGLKIYTTLDPAAQEKVEQTIALDNMPSENLLTGVAVVDTKTGAVRAVGGGPEFVPTGNNYAKKRQDLGSTVKPILDYGPAIEYLNWSTGQTVDDKRRTYKGSDQVIRNANGKYLGKMTMRKALYMSQNVPAISTFEEVGAGRASEFAGNLGIEADKPNSSSAIGGGVASSPLELAGAYASFGNGGMYTKPYTIDKVVLRDGKTERSLKPKPVSAMKDSTAYMITDMLRDVVKNPQGSGYTYVRSGGLDVAGKTGTTNYDSKTLQEVPMGRDGFAVPSSWFVGYTPEYSIAVWAGKKSYKDPIGTWDERSYPQRAFSDIMIDLAQRTDNTTFKKPKSVVEGTIVVGSDPLRLAGSGTPSSKKSTELFVRGHEPKKAAKPEKEEKEETGLAAPTGLKADYDAGQNLVNLNWKHKAPDDADGKVQFTVSYSVDGGSANTLTTTSEKNASATGIEPGRTYTFSVVAVLDGETSEPATVSLQVGEQAEPDEEEPEEVEPDENENGNGGQENPDEEDQNGNEDQQNGNQNGNNNGNGNNQGVPPGNNQGGGGNNSGGGNPGSGQGGGGQGGNPGSGNGNGNPDGDQGGNPDGGTGGTADPGGTGGTGGQDSGD
ncbi:penicillin-binding protein 1A [Edaphobacillus lindanitolerans]|uniref:Penicillin-binding protein 1A n=1 Tax=Edaphobacillus lindanitolerans TaxID=550447 RepID=A0A1U7PKI4_9BACI|nr:penicillin-binding protein 1A [Edaphobacillus lindanitolerans]SIT66272.1 penicillin-binding protein 1A [Edaphobacillus lindanitolerans]